MRLNRFVASASGLSRRAADQAVTDGRVMVGAARGVTGQDVALDAEVTLDGLRLTLPQAFRYVILNKPTGYVVSRRKQGNAPTVYDLDTSFERLRPVGRLDKDSSGLLLMSDDGDFIQFASHPSAGKLKVYELTIDRPLAAADAARLRDGVTLADGPSLVGLIERSGARLVVSLTEGRNRQLRRTFAALGYEVRRLHRRAFGALELEGLPAGGWREYLERPTI